jgi:hypothetical protein
MSAAAIHRTSSFRIRWQNATWITTALWGLLHVVGGAALVATTLLHGGRAALESLGSAASSPGIASEPGPVAEAVISFHGFDILLAGIAVLVLALWVMRSEFPRGVTTAFLIETVLDLGLVVFLIGPGHMRVADGIWGPLLLVVGVACAARAGWRPGHALPGWSSVEQ